MTFPPRWLSATMARGELEHGPPGVWGFGPNGEVRNLLSGDRAFALAFFAGREDLAAATRSGISSISDVGGSAAVSVLYTAPAPQTPSGLGTSTDNARLIMTDRAGGYIDAPDLVSEKLHSAIGLRMRSRRRVFDGRLFVPDHRPHRFGLPSFRRSRGSGVPGALGAGRRTAGPKPARQPDRRWTAHR